MIEFRAILLALFVVNAGYGCGERFENGSQAAGRPASPFRTYLAKGIPANASACDAEAQSAKERFHRASGIEPYRAECVAGVDGLDITITYVSADRLPFVRAEFGLFGSSDPDPTFPTGLDLPLWGTDASLAECRDRLGERRLDFERETGLEAVTWSCFHAMNGGFVARIDGIGSDPASRFYNLPFEFQGKVDQRFADDVSALLEAQGASVREAVPWGGYVVSMYYSPAPVTVDPRTIGFRGQTETAAACKTELDEAVRTVATIMGRDPGLARCLPDSYDSTFHLNLAYGTQERLPSYWQERGPLYATYQSCAADRADALAAFRQATGRDARGVACVMESTILPSKYQAILIGTSG